MEPIPENEPMFPTPGSRSGRGRDRPLLATVLITLLAGLLLQTAHIIRFTDLVDSILPRHHEAARLIEFGFRMAMGALLVMVAIPRVLGLSRAEGWRSEYLSLMRVSRGRSPRKAAAAVILSASAFLLVLIGVSYAAGVFSADLRPLIEGDNWLILLGALIPGVWEELAFRGALLSHLQRRFSPRSALAISSVAFGLFHFSNLLNWDDASSVVAGVIAATALGLGWGYVVIKTGSVLPAICLHYLVDVVLFDELFIDPGATDDETAIVYVSVVLLYPALTILLTRLLFRGEPQPDQDRVVPGDAAH